MSSSAPAKSQPLHNFELPPLLKWSKEGKSSGSNKRRRSMKSPPQRSTATSASPTRCSPLRDYTALPRRSRSPSQEYPATPSPISGGDSMKQAVVCEGIKHLSVVGDEEALLLQREEARRCSIGGDWFASEALRKGKGIAIEHHRNHSKISAFGSSNSEEGKVEKKFPDSNAAAIRKCNSSIKIGGKEKEESPNEELAEINEVRKEEEVRSWNLRPRSTRNRSEKAKFGADTSVKTKSQLELRNTAAKSGGKEGKGGGRGREKKEKGVKHEDYKEKGEKEKRLSLSIALTKEEIEEDIFALTGSKPSRRPKKRPKNVQKQLDSLFPGLSLVDITADKYKVSESSLK